MYFVKQRRRGWVGRLAVSEDGPEGDVAAGQANAGAGAPRYLSPACGLRLASFHHAAMVLPAQTRVKAACRRHRVMGCAQP